MKILVSATDGFGGHGGIALYTRNLVRAVCAHPSTPRVHALAYVMPFAAEALPPNLDWDVSGVGSKARYARALVRAAATGRPFDAVLCTHVRLLPLVFPIARLLRVPVVLFVYGIDVGAPARSRLVRQLASRVDAVVSIRRHTTRAFASWAPIDHVPTYHLENAIDLSRYGAGPKDPELVARFGLADKRVVLTLGRMGEPFSGTDEVLGALKAIAREAPDVVYLVAGEGPETPRLRQKAVELGVADRVVFAGFVPDDRKADYYRLADAYAMPGSGADFDRYPLRFVFLEAMACGIPVVGPRPEDPEESAEAESLLARQVDPFDSEAIARAIVDALGMPKAVPPGLARLAYPSFEARLHRILDEVVGAHRRRGRRGDASSSVGAAGSSPP